MDRQKKKLDVVPANDVRSESAVGRLYREHNETLVRFLRSHLNSEADAREAAQEAYVRILQLDRPDQPSFLRAYLFKTARHVAIDLIRRRGVRREDILTGEEPTDATQERGVIANQQLKLVQEALNSLPARCREAFILNRQEGWSAQEIAIHLGVSDRMVRLYLSRALEHLQTVLEEGRPR